MKLIVAMAILYLQVVITMKCQGGFPRRSFLTAVRITFLTKNCVFFIWKMSYPYQIQLAIISMILYER